MYLKSFSSAGAEQGADNGHRGQATSSHQKWVAPTDLANLSQEVRYAKSSGLSVRLMGGNRSWGVQGVFS